MNFLGAFWLASLAGSLFSTQSPFQIIGNQDTYQSPDSSSASHASLSISLTANESKGLSTPSLEEALSLDGLDGAHRFTDSSVRDSFMGGGTGYLAGLQTWIKTFENRSYPLVGLNPWSLLSTAAGFKPSSIDAMLPLLQGAIPLLDLRSSRIFQGSLQPLFHGADYPEFDIWSVVADIKVISAMQTKPYGSRTFQEELTDSLGSFSLSLENCVICKSKLGDNSNIQLAQWFQVWVKDHVVAEVASEQTADLLAQRFRDLLHEPDVDWSALRPAIVDGLPAAKAGDQVLYTVEDAIALPSKYPNYDNQKLAVEWVNNLRVALGKAPLTIIAAEGQPLLKQTEKRFKGIASWYGPYFHGRITATGETFNQNDLTAAHPSLPFDTYLQVRNLLNDRTVVVRVNDRGPYIGDRSLDLSREAARRLDSETIGVIPYEAVVMEPITLEDTESPLTSLAPY